MAEVSIIVPVYNCDKWLKECVDSIIAQSYNDWELILVDDGSTDSSPAICDNYAGKDSRIRCIHQVNGGVSAARNVGLDNTNSQYVMFVDGDDMLMPDAIETLMKFANDNINLRIISGAYVYDTNPNEYIDKRYNISNDSSLYIIDAKELIINTLYQKPATDTSVSWKLFKRSLFNNINFRCGRFEDLDIFYRLYLEAGKVGVCNKVVYFYRKHHSSFINSWSEGRKDILTVIDRMEEYLTQHINGVSGAIAHRRFSANYNIFVTLCRIGQSSSKLADQCYAELSSLAKRVAFDPQSRLKNRIGAFAVMLGYNFTKIISQWSSKY